MKYFLLLTIALLAGSSAMQAQYLNFFGTRNGSVPVEKLDKLTLSPTTFFLYTDQPEPVVLTRTQVDSLTITDTPCFVQSDATQQAWIRYTTYDQQTYEYEMAKVWGQNAYMALIYFYGGTDGIEYSYDHQNWFLAKDSQNFPLYQFEGWGFLTLDASTSNYLSANCPLSVSGNRSSRMKSGIVHIEGDVTGNDQTTDWKLHMPVNDAWWASPRFVADGEIRAYVNLPAKTEFTAYEGKIYWQDCELPSSWADAKGASYSLSGRAGQKLYVNFLTGDVMVSTPDEVPFPLENPIFRSSNTVDTDSDDPTLCRIEGTNGNTAVLRWDAVDGASGYRIKMASWQKVAAGGSEVWDNPDNLLMDCTVDANTTELVIPNLNYSTSYRFAIQALSPRGEQYNSAWFGYGNGRYWYAYLDLSTYKRYPVPLVLSVSDVKKTSVRVYLNTSIAGYNEEAKEAFNEHFHVEGDKVRVDYLTVEASKNNPEAVVPDLFTHYELTATDLTNGYVDIDGLTENSTYFINAWDATIASALDAYYNTVICTTKSSPGAPILLKHDELMAQAADLPIANSSEKRTEVFVLADEYDAAPISPTLNSFMTDNKMAEGQVFYLEGGKTYYLDGQDAIYKGFTLATLPDDVAQGKRAKVICGIGKSSSYYYNGVDGEQWQGPYSSFLLGRQPEEGESGQLEIEGFTFRDIDFDNPKALNYGDNVAGIGFVTGNYFLNMYSNGMGMILDNLTIENCTFKRFVRGFIREQGINSKVWKHTLIKNNQFFDCGYYRQDAGGYAMIAGSGYNEKSNLYTDMVVTGNTFYDSPFPAFIDETRQSNWDAGIKWNITFNNNTLVNFNTRGNGAIFKMRYLPDGSVYNVKNNLFVLCKQDGDQRTLSMWGADIRETQMMPGGSMGHVTLNFENNWSTNNNLTNGSIFSANAWTATSNNFGTLVRDGNATLNGTLEVQVADISATELMVSPCPPHIALSASDQNMHRADALDGTAATEYNVNLFFKSTDNDIYRNHVGATRWFGK
jgi:hypothetical protein